MTKPPFKAYEGDEPYVFVSYAHADSGMVFRDVDYLHEQGLRIWYDEGIRAGADWNDRLAVAIKRCQFVLVFVSPNIEGSPWIADEILTAKEHKRPVLAVHLVETKLSEALEHQLRRWQHVFRYQHGEDVYYAKLRDLAFLGCEPVRPAGVARGAKARRFER